MNMNKITSTKVGDDIHFYVNGTEDRGIVVKMNNEYVTVFKESTQAYDDIHINDTFFIKDILVNKEWNKMDDIERYEALKKIHAPSPRFISKAWEDLPKEITELLQKNNAIETSHKEGKDDDMNNVDTRGWDDSKKGLGGTERDRSEASTTGGDTGEGKDALETGAETKGEDSTQDAGKKVQGRKHRKEHIETNPEEKPDTHGHGKRSETKEESEGHTRASSTVESASAKFTTSGGAAQTELDRQTESSLGGNAEVQAARYSKQQMDKKREVRAGRKQQSGEIPKKVTTGVSALKAWQLWLAKREQQVLKDDREAARAKETERDAKGTARQRSLKLDEAGAAQAAADKLKPKKAAWKSWLDNQKSNTERSIHGNAGREPNSGVNTNTGFDASEDYEGFSHAGLRPEQFKHEKVKPKVTTKERINIGETKPTSGRQGTGDGGNPYNTTTQNKDVKGRAVAGKDKK
jgi:hypothetical protein